MASDAYVSPLPVFCRGHSFLPAEDSAEVQRIVISDEISDLRNIVVGGLQEHLCVGHAAFHKILHGCGVGILLEIADEPAYAHAPGSGIFLNADVRVIVVVEMLNGKLHFGLQIDIPFAVVSADLPVDLDQKLQEQQGQKIGIMGLAALELLDHLAEKPCVFKRSPGGDHAHVIGDTVKPEYILDVAAGKMNPVDFCLFRAVIYIALRLFRAVDHHLPCSHHCVFFTFVKIEMGFSGCNIQDLEIQSSSGSVSRQLRAGIQMIGSAASHDERSALVFEIHQ